MHKIGYFKQKRMQYRKCVSILSLVIPKELILEYTSMQTKEATELRYTVPCQLSKGLHSQLLSPLLALISGTQGVTQLGTHPESLTLFPATIANTTRRWSLYFTTDTKILLMWASGRI